MYNKKPKNSWARSWISTFQFTFLSTYICLSRSWLSPPVWLVHTRSMCIWTNLLLCILILGSFICTPIEKKQTVNMFLFFFLKTFSLTSRSDFPRSDFNTPHCVYNGFLPSLCPLLPPSRHPAREICACFSVCRLCLSCSSLSHACAHEHTRLHAKVLWSGKGLKLCTFPTSFTLHNTNNTGKRRTIKTHKGGGEERGGWKGIICFNVTNLKQDVNLLLYYAAQLSASCVTKHPSSRLSSCC